MSKGKNSFQATQAVYKKLLKVQLQETTALAMTEITTPIATTLSQLSKLQLKTKENPELSKTMTR